MEVDLTAVQIWEHAYLDRKGQTEARRDNLLRSRWILDLEKFYRMSSLDERVNSCASLTGRRFLLLRAQAGCSDPAFDIQIAENS